MTKDPGKENPGRVAAQEMRKARDRKLSPGERSELARRAAKARWAKGPKDQKDSKAHEK